MNFKLTLQYDGTDFHGWQMQGDDHQRTVQGELARVLALIDGGAVTVHGSGRTDAGVHAEGQVASVELRREFSPWKLRAGVNGNLARDVRVIEACEVADDFHARYSARGKTYVYRIFNAPVVSPFWFRYAQHEARPLDMERMRAAARLFLGQHDWTAFSAAQSEAVSRVRDITRLEITEAWEKRGRGRLIEITVSADGFLRYMVRSIAGTLMAAGRGELDEERVALAISTGARELVGATAPACGLTLVHVQYD
ncbi:MAG TPA: tRNA pseudouridine(38-40) synthase TruA [Pyrinomonadaceae bacterium]|jgi:tRNA pseudouridine38-40 synthase|nr:tRNA pseudouridine(38-40) synthase TruA [Pyrinomonadaceae bacterium]